MTATPAVISGSRQAVRLVLGAAASVAAALVLLGLLAAVLAARPAGADTALGLGLGAAGAAALGVGLLVVARAGALARRPTGRTRAVAVLSRCLLAATVVAVAMLVVGVVAVSASRAVAPGLGAGVAAMLLVGLATLAGRTRHRLPAAPDRPVAPQVVPVPVIPAQRTAEPAPVARGASDPGPAADAR